MKFAQKNLGPKIRQFENSHLCNSAKPHQFDDIFSLKMKAENNTLPIGFVIIIDTHFASGILDDGTNQIQVPDLIQSPHIHKHSSFMNHSVDFFRHKLSLVF